MRNLIFVSIFAIELSQFVQFVRLCTILVLNDGFSWYLLKWKTELNSNGYVVNGCYQVQVNKFVASKCNFEIRLFVFYQAQYLPFLVLSYTLKTFRKSHFAKGYMLVKRIVAQNSFFPLKFCTNHFILIVFFQHNSSFNSSEHRFVKYSCVLN